MVGYEEIRRVFCSYAQSQKQNHLKRKTVYKELFHRSHL